MKEISFTVADDVDINGIRRCLFRYFELQEMFGGIEQYGSNIESKKSQFNQDLFVLCSLNFKHKGFFVEAGACDGIMNSNSFLLEKKFDWQGILVEPVKSFHDALFMNRSCHIETSVVYNESGLNLDFSEANEKDLSTLTRFQNSDNLSYRRDNSKNVILNSISLIDLLKKYNAPRIIDYLSLDTEGSEFDILQSFDFNQYKFRVITIEHNNEPQKQEKIFHLLTKQGYSRVYKELSKVDDWYLSKNLVSSA
jgi:FkbM family methyltransferase